MTDVIETSVLKSTDGWKVARIIVHRNGTQLSFALRFKPDAAVYYFAQRGAQTVGARDMVALHSWLALKSFSDAPGFRAFIDRWHYKASLAAGWQCPVCERRMPATADRCYCGEQKPTNGNGSLSTMEEL